MTPGITQIILIILLVMVFFGAGRIPAVMENLAKGVKSFKKGLNDDSDDKVGTSSLTKENNKEE